MVTQAGACAALAGRHVGRVFQLTPSRARRAGPRGKLRNTNRSRVPRALRVQVGSRRRLRQERLRMRGMHRQRRDQCRTRHERRGGGARREGLPADRPIRLGSEGGAVPRSHRRQASSQFAESIDTTRAVQGQNGRRQIPRPAARRPMAGRHTARSWIPRIRVPPRCQRPTLVDPGARDDPAIGNACGSTGLRGPSGLDLAIVDEQDSECFTGHAERGDGGTARRREVVAARDEAHEKPEQRHDLASRGLVVLRCTSLGSFHSTPPY